MLRHLPHEDFPLSVDLRPQLQKTLGDAYRLERELGGGGMSRVFVAEETRLKRKVVVKVLSPELAQGLSIDRFEREIQTAAALQQANIVPVLTAGDTDGLPFYTMPFVEGESLRARLGRGPLAVTEVIGVLRDVSKALAYAHRQGVVHRDIKPDNVLLSEGTAVVTDFGIAKAISAARTSSGSATLTQIGTSIGTPAYMAPEQAAGDPNIDHRADIYSLGAMAYELLSGHPVFPDRSAQRMLAAHMGEAPRPITDLRVDLPAPLAELVMRCLAKEPTGRPQAAGDIVSVLETITSGSGMQSMPPVLLGGPGMFRKALAIYAAAFVAVAILAKAAIVGIGLPDWVFPGSLIVMALGMPVVLWTGYVQRVTRRAMTMTPTLTPGGTPSLVQGTMATMALKAAPHVSWYKTARGGIYAIGAFIIVIAAFMGMRAIGIGPAATLLTSGKLDAKDKLIIAEFKSAAGDTLLGATVTDAFRTDLAQSKTINVLSSAVVRDALRRMQRPDSTKVTEEIARQIAAREGMKAMIAGEVVALGGGYVLSARLVSTIGNEELATFRETAADSRDIIPAIGRLSKSVRTKVGENLRRVQAARTLDKVTTPSLEALQKYVQAARLVEMQGDWERAKPLFEAAIALDTGFAMAYRKLAIEEQNRFGSRARIQTLLQKAFDHRNQLTDQERLITESSYYSYGPRPDRDKAVAALEQLLELDPVNVTALNNLSVSYRRMRQYARAEEYARRAVAEQPTASVFFNNVLFNQVQQGKLSAADTTLKAMAAALPRNPQVTSDRLFVAYARTDYDLAAAYARQLVADPSRAVQQGGTDLAAAIAATRGNLATAARYRAAASELQRSAGVKSAPIDYALLDATDQLWFRNDKEGAVRHVDAVLAATPLEGLPIADRPYATLAEFFARADRLDRAKAMLTGFEKKHVEAAEQDDDFVRHRLAGVIAIAEKKYDEAARELQAADSGECAACTAPLEGLAHDLAGRTDLAIAAYERGVNDRTFFRAFNDAAFLGSSLKRLGELYEAKGDKAKAIGYYQKFVDLWKNADPELQPRVGEAKLRLAKLAPVERSKP